jgi:hypothetical protein
MVDVEIQFAVSPLARDHVTDPSLPFAYGGGEQWQNAGKRETKDLGSLTVDSPSTQDSIGLFGGRGGAHLGSRPQISEVFLTATHPVPLPIGNGSTAVRSTIRQTM